MCSVVYMTLTLLGDVTGSLFRRWLEEITSREDSLLLTGGLAQAWLDRA